MPTPHPDHRICSACHEPFVLSVQEQAFLTRVAASLGETWALPNRCTACRRAARQERYRVVDDGQDEWLVCQACGEPFRFGGRDKTFYAAQGFMRPRRCHACRRRRATLGSSDASPAATGASARLRQVFDGSR